MNNRETLLAYAADKTAEAVALNKQYPGVRPSWVSTDIALANHAARMAREEAASLQETDHQGSE